MALGHLDCHRVELSTDYDSAVESAEYDVEIGHDVREGWERFKRR